MSKKFKQTYNAFNREILKRFLNDKQLAQLDIEYSKAKLERLIDTIAKQCGVPRETIKVDYSDDGLSEIEKKSSWIDRGLATKEEVARSLKK